MLTYLDYTLHSLRGNRALCGYTNTSLPVTTVITDMARIDNDKIFYKVWDTESLIYLSYQWKEVIHYLVSKRFY